MAVWPIITKKDLTRKKSVFALSVEEAWNLNLYNQKFVLVQHYHAHTNLYRYHSASSLGNQIFIQIKARLHHSKVQDSVFIIN